MDRRNFLRGAFALAALGSNPIFSISKALAATANTAPFLDPWIVLTMVSLASIWSK